jgi:hypothetical protein
MPNHLVTIRDAAQEYGRIFYVMYDMSGAGTAGMNAVRRTQLDWIYSIERKGIVSSPSYAKAEGRPVVCIWGVDAGEASGISNKRYIENDAAIALTKWFQARGYYVIGGVPDGDWWNRTDAAHNNGYTMYSSFDMISPWYIGRDVVGSILNTRLTQELAFCKNNSRSWAGNKPIAFMPTVWPGFAWTNMNANGGQPNATPRNAGQWIWTQIQGYLNRDSNNVIESLYFAMMDEYDEGTNWMKAGTDFFDIPLDQYFQTHAADGIWVSSDYYLRMAKAAATALAKKNAAGGGSTAAGAAGYNGPLNNYTDGNSIIVEHSEGPVYWRNSFERRNGRLKYGAGEGQSGIIAVPVSHLQIDVGIPNGGVTGNTQNVTINGDFTVNRPKVENNATSINWAPPSTTLGMVYKTNADAKSGDSAFRLTGQRTAGTNASYLYKIADTRIKGNNSMKLSFWQKAGDTLGANVVVDLLLDSGTYVSTMSGYNLQGTASVNNWVQRTVDLPNLNGRYITAVIVAYRDTGTETGNFTALIDDIVVENR